MCVGFSKTFVTAKAFESNVRRVAAGWNLDVNVERVALRLGFHIGAATVGNEPTFEAHYCRLSLSPTHLTRGRQVECRR
jgi:hypothetical protein